VAEWDERKDRESREAVLEIFEQGIERIRQLLDENAELRRELRVFQQQDLDTAATEDEGEKLREELMGRVEELETERQSILQRLQTAENENREFAERAVAVEKENNNLANLYVASYQLHSTLDPSEVVKVVLEIVINLIGAEIFAVYLCEEGSDVLGVMASEGEGLECFPQHRVGHGLVGRSVARGEVEVGDATATGGAPSGGADPIVAIPLQVDESPVGAIAIYKLLEQKDGFTVLDHELFTLLGRHAATAIVASRLYAQSERKLSTIQGFIDLLTK
jgi:hypothetical protein